uniref:OTU domain-containing protein n=1 Tax=Phytophthora ramorum TaxID=164328 RepID=H3GY35_PHYRM
MARKAVKLARKAPKIIFEAATGKKLHGVQAKHKKKSSSYVVDDDCIKLMRKQLATVGCKLHEVEADGNCLFRALGDQLYGDQHRHEDIREVGECLRMSWSEEKIVTYLEQHRDDFEPFMEDEEKFETYCERMREDGTWGGNQELYAAARLFQVYVVVHQDQPSARIMVIECDRLKPTRFAHVAYHGEDHYDSVRALRDPVDPDGLPISIELDCDGFRSQDFAKRWQAYAPTPGTAGEDQVAQRQQRVVPITDGDVDQLASRLGGQLQVSAGATRGAAGNSLSKKEQRQLRKAEKAEKAARKQRSAPK